MKAALFVTREQFGHIADASMDRDVDPTPGNDERYVARVSAILGVPAREIVGRKFELRVSDCCARQFGVHGDVELEAARRMFRLARHIGADGVVTDAWYEDVTGEKVEVARARTAELSAILSSMRECAEGDSG